MDVSRTKETLTALALSGLKGEETGCAFLRGKITVNSG